MEWFATEEASAWREWLVALLGLVGAVVALNTYRLSVNVRQREQARLVYAKVADSRSYAAGTAIPINDLEVDMENLPQRWYRYQVDPYSGQPVPHLEPDTHVAHIAIEVHNESDELMGPVRVVPDRVGLGMLLDNTVEVTVIEPGTKARLGIYVPMEVARALPSIRPFLTFRDASGRWWMRHGADPIRRIAPDPENSGPTPIERRGIRTYQEAIGVPPEQRLAEPNVPIRAAIRRWLRRLRGLPILPWYPL